MKTPVWQLPYPALADPADIMGADGVDDLAARLEVVLTQLRAGGSIPGELKLWPGGTLPLQATYGHWVWADGASYVSATYPLAAANVDAGWRTFSGASDPGGTNFRVPDLRGVSPAGLDAMPGGARANRATRSVAIVIAGRAGEEYHQITLAEMPAHGHPITDPLHVHTGTPTPISGVYGAGSTQDSASVDNWHDKHVNPTNLTSAATGISVNNTGGGGAHENLPPTVYVPYIVKLDD